MARKLARIAAMQLIYERMEGGEGGEETLRGLIGFEPAAPAEKKAETAEEEQPGGVVPAGENEEEEPSLPDPEYEEDLAFIRTLVDGVAGREAELDERISAYLRGWSLSRVARVDAAILRLAVYEMIYLPETPASVVINEAVEMAKRYSTDRSGAFVNGVLGAMSRGEKP